MNFGSKYLQDKVVKDCLQGKKFICLAITEPLAGSDVAGMRTTAVKDPTGKFYIVNGEKKWCVARRLRRSCRVACLPG
jgi:alkylation response protein AidB-like acyl-CoA dehydrogenase